MVVIDSCPPGRDGDPWYTCISDLDGNPCCSCPSELDGDPSAWHLCPSELLKDIHVFQRSALFF